MARVQNTLIGRASGSVGNVVFLTWKLLNVTRSKPLSVFNPDTVPQQQQRNKFGSIVELYRIIKPVVTIGLNNRNKKMSIFNFFQYLNQQQAFENLGGGLILFKPEKLTISYGLLPKMYNLVTFAIASTKTCGQSFFAPFDLGNDNDFKIAMVAFNETKNEWAYGIEDVPSDTTGYSLQLPSNISSGDTVHVWSFLSSNLSNSIQFTNYGFRLVP